MDYSNYLKPRLHAEVFLFILLLLLCLLILEAFGMINITGRLIGLSSACRSQIQYFVSPNR